LLLIFEEILLSCDYNKAGASANIHSTRLNPLDRFLTMATKSLSFHSGSSASASGYSSSCPPMRAIEYIAAHTASCQARAANSIEHNAGRWTARSDRAGRCRRRAAHMAGLCITQKSCRQQKAIVRI